MRRIAAIVLPDLACEIARPKLTSSNPFAVIVDADEASVAATVDKTAVLDAVDSQAWQYGARPGQRASQAAAYVGRLTVIRISRARVLEALGAVAEVALNFGIQSAVALDGEGLLSVNNLAGEAASLRYPLGAGAGPLDTVWLDVTGCAQLVGGEEQLCAELFERARELGHRARVAIAAGPRIAQAIARWSVEPTSSLKESGMQRLSVAALPLPPDMICWLSKLGILCIEDLARIDPARLAHRLGPHSRDLLELIAGRDDMPLVAYQPPRRIVETATFDSNEGSQTITSTEPLMFVLRGLIARAVARLNARGEACARVAIHLPYDRGVISLENSQRAEPLARACSFVLDLPLALSRETELLRVVQAKLETLELAAPVTALTLTLDELTEQSCHQLALTGKTAIDPSALPTLLAELNAHLGPGRVGVLRIVDSHRPEARSVLLPPHSPLPPPPSSLTTEPTRLLPTPLSIPSLEPGALLMLANHPFTLEHLRPTSRLEGIDWWSPSPLTRDYLQATLRTTTDPSADTEALVYFDRQTRTVFLHGWFE